MEPFVRDGEVLVHIGLPKTGTTALQSCVAARRDLLLDHGVLYPGSAPEQVVASFAPLEWFEPPRIEADARRQWADLTAAVSGHRDRMFISAENLCVAGEAAVRRVVDGLGGERVRVLVTLRGLHHVLPSFWQHQVRAGLQVPFDEWAEATASGPGEGVGRGFWHVFDMGNVIERWAGVVGADRVAVLVVDPDRPTSVYAHVEQLLGLPDGLLDPSLTERSNRSLTAAEAEILRRVNVRLADVSFPNHDVLNGRYVRSGAIRHLIEGRTPGPGEPRLTVPPAAMTRLRPLAEAAIADIERIGPLVVGDLQQLVPPFARPGSVDRQVDAPMAVADTVPIDAAVLLIEKLLPKPKKRPKPKKKKKQRQAKKRSKENAQATPEPTSKSTASAASPAGRVEPFGDGTRDALPRRLARRLLPVRTRRALLARMRR